MLTAQGRRYLAAVRPGLEALRAAHRGVAQARGPLEVACASGLAVTWLAPRLGGFLRGCPDVSLTLRSIAAEDPRAQADLTITFGPRPGPEAVHLLDVAFFPVAQPAFYEAEGRPAPGDLTPGMLLHLNNRDDWAGWLRAAGAEAQAASGGVRFQGLLAMYAAAEAGLGLCLGDSLTCGAALRAGRLIRPYAAEVRVPAGYWALPAAGGLTAPAAAFLDWIRREL
ncbi:LysR substrate-binding domain-containing protein [Paenirhodobacter sp.]|uniref:LysR substrate-binding domain-containing protein n=1 Tax=Paenirhodobacter sp. TaxID=1965326 RepID=UPI003B3DA4D9